MSRPENENPKERLEKTARELRKHRPRPSEALVARIERLAERGAARRSRSPRLRLSRRRLVLALAAALAVAVAGAIVHGELQSSNTVASHRVAQVLTTNGHAFGRLTGSAPQAQKSGAGSTTQALDKAKKTAFAPSPAASSGQTTTGGVNDQFTEQVPAARAVGSGPTLSAASGAPSTTSREALSPLTTGNRLADLRAVLTLKVKDGAQLSRATAKAMKIALSLGGYIATAHYQTPSRGVATSTLKLKVPARRAQKALSRISTLGEILSQRVSLKDVQRTVAAEADQIKALQQRISELESSLSDSSLTPSARSQLQVQLANARANLRSQQVQRSANIRRGRLATITVTFTTGNLPKTPSHPSRIHKAVDRAWNGLSSEISWVAMALIVASPFILLAVVLAVLVRIRKRREERRLLEK